MFIGHLPISYLLSQTPALFGHPLNVGEQIFVVINGYVPDLDLVVSKFFVEDVFNHHDWVTHTPIFIFAVWLLELILFRTLITNPVLMLGLVSMLLHLAMDDIGYWFTRIGWQSESKHPQIQWAYPWRKRAPRTTNSHGNLFSVIIKYIYHSPVNAILELALSVIAFFIFLHQIHVF